MSPGKYINISMARTIQSPGVEIKEVDLSLRPQLPVGTTVFTTGFTVQGPTDEVIQVASLSEFEQIYGKPTNAAERYFYHTVRGVFQSAANVLVSRLPYGEGTGSTTAEKYSALLYPVVAVSGTSTADSVTTFNQVTALGTGAQTHDLSAADAYFLGEPSLIDLSENEYQQILNEQFTWERDASTCTQAYKNKDIDTFAEIGKAGVIVLNNKKFAINEKFEGYYTGLIDNANQNPATDYDGFLELRSLNKNTTAPEVPGGYVKVPDARLTFALSAASTNGLEGSISEVAENFSSTDLLSNEFHDVISIGVFKIRQSTLDPDTNKLDYVLTEAYTGSLNFFREQFKEDGGNATSYFIESEVAGSPNFKIMVNPWISKYGGNWLDDNGIPTKRVRIVTNKSYTDANAYLNVTEQAALSGALNAIQSSATNGLNGVHAEKLYPHGVFSESTAVTREVGTIPSKLDRVFELVDNHELYPIDITVDGGLSTIWAASSGGNKQFDDEEFVDLSDGTGNKDTGGLFTTNLDIDGSAADAITYRDNFRTITKRFVDFAQNKRKDNIFISDPSRHVFVNGQNNKTLDDKTKNFSQHIYWPLRHLYGTDNTSYAATYANWAKVYDEILNKQIWVPMSGRIAALYANTDANFQPWIAPAGFTRGVLSNVNDLALYPKQKQRDQLYKIRMNPIANFPNDGFVVFGQKTLQVKPSAFDRVNVRRLFLFLEKATRATVKYFVFEPNTLFTRTQVINVLTPIFENAKNTQGLYDYMIICDERNNTPDVIDRNELVVDIYLKPVRAAEFILVNFYATRTGQDFSELVS